MAISKKEVEYIANLARLKLSQQEIEDYTHDLDFDKFFVLQWHDSHQ